MEKNKKYKRIGNYNIIKEIGRPNSRVYLGQTINNPKKKVAIKIIPLDELKDHKVHLEFNKTIHLLENINHPNIINILSKEQSKTNYYIIFEYANGGELGDYLENYIKKTNHPFEEKYIQKIIRQVSEGLSYLHSKNIIHRDIKLENLLINFENESANTLDDEFTIKIRDFALAREMIDDTRSASVCGTSETMAPEVLNASMDHKYSSRADLWSLGISTFQLVTGELPFNGINNSEVLDNINKGVYTYNKNLNISIECIKFIYGLLQFEPAKRFNWSEIKEHPFLAGDEKDFVKLKSIIKKDFEDINYLQVNIKKKDNFLWKIYNNGNMIGIPFENFKHKSMDDLIDSKFYDKNEGKINLSYFDGKN